MKHRYILNYLIIILLLTHSFRGNAQAVEFEHLTLKNGLPDNTIVATVQDKKGFIWIATQGGLSRYDGFTIETWSSTDGTSAGLLSNKICCMAVDTFRNCIYLGYYSGFSVFDLEHERFEHYSSSFKHDNASTSDYVRAIVVDLRSRVWLGTERNGLCEFLPNKKALSYVSNTPQFPITKRITGLSADPNGKLWVACQSNILMRYNPEFNTVDSLSFRSTQRIDTPISKGVVLFCDHSNRLWIGTEDEGVYVYDVKIRSFIRHYTTDNSSLNSNFVSHISQDGFGAIWIGTDKGGLLRWRNDSLHVFKHIDGNSKTLSSNIITHVFESHDGCLWVGTYNAGLNVYKRYKHKFLWAGGVESNLQLPSTEHSVLSFAETRNGTVWIGLDGGGLVKYNPFNKKLEREPNAQLPSVVKSMYADKDGSLWIGSYGRGLWKYQTNTQNIELVNFTNDPVLNSKSSIWALQKDSYNWLWVSVLNNGIYCILPNKKGSIALQHTGDKASLANSNVQCFYEDSKQNMWIGTDGGGLDFFNRETRNFTHIPLVDNKNGKKNQLIVNSLVEDRDGCLWVGTSQKGLFKLCDVKNKAPKHFGKEWLVPQKDIMNIQCDLDNSIWICTKNNIYQFNEHDSTCKVFDMDDGLQQSQFSPAASFRDNSGLLYFGGADGFNLLDTRHIDYQTHAPQVVITSFELFNRALSPNEAIASTQYVNKNISYTDTIRLKNSDFSFAISFASLDYTLPQSNEYQYLLEGYDEGWITARGTNRRAIYTNLPSGEYTFWVRASNCDNVWSLSPARLCIIIAKPWWLRWWIWLIVVATIGVVVLFIRILMKKQKTQSEKDLEIAVEERNKVLIERNAEFQARVELLEQSNHTKERLLALIGHDLKNPFNVLINFSGLLVKDYESVPDDKRPRIFAAIHQSATSIFNMMTNLLDWARSQTGDLQYNPQPINLYTLVDGCIALFTTSAEHKRLNIINDTSPDIQVFVDEDMIKTVFRNLISNSIKYSFENGTITICTRRSSHEFIEVSVIDEGMGISKEHAEHLFSLEHASFHAQHGKEHGTGLGLLICKEFLEQHGSIIKVDSVLHKGSTVIFYLQMVNM